MHSFHETTFKKPTFCGDCGKIILGVVKQGLECESKLKAKKKLKWFKLLKKKTRSLFKAFT
jgi:hypothetical protein